MSYYFQIKNNSIEATNVNPSNLRKTVAEALGLPRLIVVDIGYEKDPSLVKNLIETRLPNMVVWAIKDKKVYLANSGWLDKFGISYNLLDDKSRSVLIEILKKEIHPAFNNIGKIRLKTGFFKNLDGVVIILKSPRPTAQIAVAWTNEKGIMAAKGTCVTHDNQWLDCPPVPDGYDGWLNVSEFSLNGVKLSQGYIPEDREIELTNLKDFWVSLQTNLNIYKSKISPAIAGLWPLAARKRWLQKAEDEIKSLVKTKANAVEPKDVTAVISNYGHIDDFLRICEKVGAFPEGTLTVVEELFSLAIMRVITEGPTNLMAFGYHFPSNKINPGEIVVPREVLQRSNLLDKFLQNKTVLLESWRNPVLPGLDEKGRSPSAGLFRVVGISNDKNFYLHYRDVQSQQGDFDGDRQCVSLESLYGLSRLSEESVPVRKNKESRIPEEGDILNRKLGGLSSYLGRAYNMAMAIEDRLFAIGKNDSVGKVGWTAVQSCLVSQKHVAEATIDGTEYSSYPNLGQYNLDWGVLQTTLQYRAVELGVTAKPTKSLAAYRWLRRVKKTLLTTSTILSKLPTRSEGLLASLLKMAQFSTRIRAEKLKTCKEQEFREFILNALRRRKEELSKSETNFRVDAQKVRDILNELIRKQNEGASETSEIETTKGLHSFYAQWSMLMAGAQPYDRVQNMIRLLISLPKGTSLWLTVKVLGADYQIVRSITVENSLPFEKVWQPCSINLWERKSSTSPLSSNDDNDEDEFREFLNMLDLEE